MFPEIREEIRAGYGVLNVSKTHFHFNMTGYFYRREFCDTFNSTIPSTRAVISHLHMEH